MSVWMFELRILEAIVRGRCGRLLAPSFYRTDACPRTELQLHKDCVRVFKRTGWKLVAHEWPVKMRNGRAGVGDLVFRRANVYFVMECKRRHKQKVYDQAVFYATAWNERVAARYLGAIVLYGVWTCRSQEVLGRLP